MIKGPRSLNDSQNQINGPKNSGGLVLSAPAKIDPTYQYTEFLVKNMNTQTHEVSSDVICQLLLNIYKDNDASNTKKIAYEVLTKNKVNMTQTDVNHYFDAISGSLSNDDRYAYFGKNKKSFDNFETQKVFIDSDKIQVDDDVLKKYSSDTTITDLIESVYRDNDEDMTVKIVTKIWNNQIKEEYKTPHPYFPLTRGLVKNQDEVRQVLNDMKSGKWGNGIFADMLEMRIIKEAKHTVATPESVITGMIKIFFDF